MKRVLSVLLAAAVLLTSMAFVTPETSCEQVSDAAASSPTPQDYIDRYKPGDNLGGKYAWPKFNQVSGFFCSDTLLPSTGSPKILSLCIDFPDAPADSEFPHQKETYRDYYNTLTSDLFDPYDPAKPIEDQSVRGMFYCYSYGKLDLQGTLLPIYTAPQTSDHYPTTSEQAELVKEAVKYFIAEEIVDPQEYDADHNGAIDCVLVMATWNLQKELGYESLFARDCCIGGGDNLLLNKIVHVEFFSYQSSEDREIVVHELAHAMGLKDTYNTSAGYSNYLDRGLNDVMDNTVWVGTFNMLSKWALGWIDPLILTREDLVDGSLDQSVSLLASETAPEDVTDEPLAILLIPDPTLLPFSSFYLIEYRKNGAVIRNEQGYYTSTPIFSSDPGLVVWYCRTEIREGYDDFKYPTSFLKPVYKYHTGSLSGRDAYDEKDLFYKGDVFRTTNGAYMKVLGLSEERAVVTAGFKDPYTGGPPQITMSWTKKSDPVRRDHRTVGQMLRV